MIGLVWATSAGHRAAQRLSQAWPGECTIHTGSVREQLTRAWGDANDGIVAFLAVGATVRVIAPLLKGKRADPGVVCVDEAGRYAIAIVSGHEGGANSLAHRVAQTLGAEPIVTTATDSAGIPGLDTLGFAVANPERLAPVSRAMLDGEPVAWICDTVWPLPALPDNVGTYPQARHGVLVTDRVMPLGDALVLHPPSLVLGVGASRGVSEEEIEALVRAALHAGALSPESVSGIATVDVKADEEGLLAYARKRNLPVLTFSADALSKVEVPNPSEAVRLVLGTPSVAEASVMLAGGTLVVPKMASKMATVAVGRLQPRGRLAVVGLGPGGADLRTPRATEELRRASVVVGLDQYVNQIRAVLRPGTRVFESGLGNEYERAKTAVDLARAGNAVALIGSGDAGIYAMASPALEMADDSIEVVVVPGVTAALAASALLGAPLGHDHAYLSLSDLHTPWEVIEHRLYLLAQADLVVCLYNPRSSRRTRQLPQALRILGESRPPGTPVGLVREAAREGQNTAITTLAEVDPSKVDMNTLVIVGATTTRIVAGRLVTPRGYTWMKG